MKKPSSKAKRSSTKKRPYQFPPFFKSKSLDVLLLFLLIGLVGYAWRRLPEIAIRSDGFLHMLSREQERFWSHPYWITGIEVNASILGAILPKFFGANIGSYLWFEWVVMLLIVFLFYIMVRIITKSSLLAFASTIIAGVSYFGNWDMYGTHCYCFFLERVTNVPFILLSFIFLHVFLTGGKKKHLLASLFLYAFGMVLGHLALLFTPPFILYPFWWYVLHSFKRESWKGIGIGGAYFIISLCVVLAQKITYGDWGPGWTFREFIFNPDKFNYFKGIPLQLFHWSQYHSILPNLYSQNPLRDVDSYLVESGIPYVLVVYFLLFVILYKKLPKFRALLLTCISGVAGIFFLNLYVRYNEVIVSDSNRYLYYPTFFISVFWGIALWYFFLSRKTFLQVLGVFLLIAYYHVNVVLLDHIVNRGLGWDRSTKAIFTYIFETRASIKPNTLIVAPYPEFWVQEAGFFTETLGKNNVRYYTDSTAYKDWKKMIPNYTYVIRLSYDQKCNCVKETKIK